MSLIDILRSGRIVLHIVSGQLGVGVGSFRVGGFRDTCMLGSPWDLFTT